jgi:hypothetical protein
VNDNNQTYRTLHFLVLRGDWFALAAAVGVLLIAIAFWLINSSVWALPVGVILSAFVYIIMRSYVELVRVIVDMLLPK